MGLLDLSTSASAKKHVDLNDARYQLVDKLKNNDKKNIRPTFTLYDNKEIGKVTTKEISAAYDLSDKKLPMGELMNKMVDMVVDLEDGILNSEKDCIYAWKYAVTIMAMYEDLRAISAEAQEALAESASYHEVKEWFLHQFPAIASFHKKREKMLAF